MKTLTILFATLALAMGQEATKLEMGKPSIKAPESITIPEITALKLKSTQLEVTIKTYQIQEYWKAIQVLQEIVKKDGEVIQDLSAKVFADAKVSKDEWRISEDGLKLEKVSRAIAKAPKGKPDPSSNQVYTQDSER
jgi:hypothetical protein